MSVTEFLILLTSFLVIAGSVDAADISLQANDAAAPTFEHDSAVLASVQCPLFTGLEISKDLVRSRHSEDGATDSTAFEASVDLSSYVAFAPSSSNFFSDLKL